VNTVPTRGTRGSFRFHPVRTTAALAEIGAAAVALRRTIRRVGPTLIDANSVRSGLIAVNARRRADPPVVVRVRDVLPHTPAGHLVAHLVRRRSAGLIANSAHTAQRFPGRGGAALRVLNPSIDVERFAGAQARAETRRALGVPADAPVLVIVAQITQWKGQADGIKLLEVLRRTHPDARLLLVGEAKFVETSTRYDNRTYLAGLQAAAGRLGDGAVSFLGEREDVPDVLGAADLALVPSWEEPFGRSVVEAMAAGVPVIATTTGGPREVITDGEDGFLLPPCRPERWAALAAELLDDPGRRARVAERARGTARRYDRLGQPARVLEQYRALGVI
jgi:glycosyltransferase involved in cell wall biosynthesis